MYGPVHDPPGKKDTTRGCPLVVFAVLTLRAEKRTGTGRPSGVDLLRPKRLSVGNKLCDFNNLKEASGNGVEQSGREWNKHVVTVENEWKRVEGGASTEVPRVFPTRPALQRP